MRTYGKEYRKAYLKHHGPPEVCGYCHERFGDGHRIDVHHVDGNRDNNSAENLVALHASCHTILHVSQDRAAWA